MRTTIAILLACSISGCSTGPAQDQGTTGTRSVDSTAGTDPLSVEESRISERIPVASDTTKYTWTIIPVERGTFGYDIYSNGKLYIHQTSIPGQMGSTGFTSKGEAKMAALAALQQLRSGVMPPGHAEAGQQALDTVRDQ